MRMLTLLFLVGLATLADASPMTSTEIDQLVQRLQATTSRQPSLQANFREERHLAMLKEPIVNEGKVWFTLPDKIRREIEGRKMSIYYPNYQQVEVYDLEKRPIIKDSLHALTAGLDFREIKGYFDLQGSKDGNQYQITLIPKTAAVRKVIQSVDLTIGEDLIPEKVTVHNTKGEVFTSFSNVRRENIPDSTFEFTPPPGTKVTTPLGN